MSDYASILVSFVELESQAAVPAAPPGRIRLWANASDNNNFYSKDEADSSAQITNGPALATGNAQYLWDWFENGAGVTIPDYSVVTLVQGGVNDGKIVLSDSDDIAIDTFLGIVYGGSIAPGGTGKVIYAGKVPGAAAGRGWDSRTYVYMSTIPGQFTNVDPGFSISTIFQIGFTKGDDLYLRPVELSDLG